MLSAHEYTNLHLQFLYNCHKQQPSKQGELVLNVKGKAGKVSCMGAELLLTSYLYPSM
jgi:hypothetical protein